MRLGTQLRNSPKDVLGDMDYAEGGAREARCRAQGLEGVACSGRLVFRATCCTSGIRFSRATARTGACRTWQTWQVVSGPLCAWRNAKPVATYSSNTQPNRVSAGRAKRRRESWLKRIPTPYSSTLDEQTGPRLLNS